MWSFEALFGERASSGDERKSARAKRERRSVSGRWTKEGGFAKRNLHTLKNF